MENRPIVMSSEVETSLEKNSSTPLGMTERKKPGGK
jgi:hypothetical protein